MSKSYSVSEITKRQLCDSLKALMGQKPLEKITIREVTEGCGLQRQAFYYHFQDIYDLVRWMFQQEAVSLLQQHEGALLWQEGLLQLFHYLQENKAICLCALKSISRSHLKRFFQADIYAIIHHTIDGLVEQMQLPSEKVEQELLTHMFVIALAGIMESWLLGEFDCTPEELIHITDLLLQDQLEGAKMRRDRQAGASRQDV